MRKKMGKEELLSEEVWIPKTGKRLSVHISKEGTSLRRKIDP